jgi:hypothetical protein
VFTLPLVAVKVAKTVAPAGYIRVTTELTPYAVLLLAVAVVAVHVYVTTAKLLAGTTPPDVAAAEYLIPFP